MKRTIRLTESDLHKVINESVKRILSESVSYESIENLKTIFNKAFNNLNDDEKDFICTMLEDETWDAVYTALNVLKPY